MPIVAGALKPQPRLLGPLALAKFYTCDAFLYCTVSHLLIDETEVGLWIFGDPTRTTRGYGEDPVCDFERGEQR